MTPELMKLVVDLGGWGALAIIAHQLVLALREQARESARYQAEVAQAIQVLADRVDENRRYMGHIGNRIIEHTTERRRTRR